MSFRNRCTLSGANGPISITIPLAGGRDQKRLMKDVRIDNRGNWQIRHWRTLESCYNKSPWFDHYRESLRLVYSRKTDFLVDWNLECMGWITDTMAIDTRCELSTAFTQFYDESKFLDRRDHYLPSTIKNLQNSAETYHQVFEDRFGFLPNLSILDKLFCSGPHMDQ